jgi:hypothetical protein
MPTAIATAMTRTTTRTTDGHPAPPTDRRRCDHRRRSPFVFHKKEGGSRKLVDRTIVPIAVLQMNHVRE